MSKEEPGLKLILEKLTNGLTISDFSKKEKVSRRTMYNWQNGKIPPFVKTIIRTALTNRIKLEDLFETKENDGQR